MNKPYICAQCEEETEALEEGTEICRTCIDYNDTVKDDADVLRAREDDLVGAV